MPVLRGYSEVVEACATICIHCDSQSPIGTAQSNSIMVSQDIYIEDTIPLDNYSQQELYLLTM